MELFGNIYLNRTNVFIWFNTPGYLNSPTMFIINKYGSLLIQLNHTFKTKEYIFKLLFLNFEFLIYTVFCLFDINHLLQNKIKRSLNLSILYTF